MLTYLMEALKNYEEDYGLQREPDFQRGHVWIKDQQVKYMEFLLRGGNSSRVIFFNHPKWSAGENGEFVLVDGLQRLTAAERFMQNKLPVFGYYLEEWEDQHYLGRISLRFNINNLQTRADVLRWYLELNDGGTPHSSKEIQKVKGLLEKEIGSR